MFMTRTFRLALLVSLAALIPLDVAAQTTRTVRTPVRAARYPWSIGITGGATLSKIHPKDNTALHNTWGLVAGLTATRSFNRNVGVQIEALVAQRGTQTLNGDTTLRLTYLDVPLLVRVGSTTTNRTHVHAFTGLTPGFKLNATLSDNAVRLTPTITDNIKGFDLGLPIGVEVEQGAWSFDVRYTFGLVNINGLPGGMDSTNRSAAFKVGYRLR